MFLVDLIPELRARGGDATVISLSGGAGLGSRLHESGTPLISLGFEGNVYELNEIRRVTCQMRTLLKKGKPEILHSHLYMADLVARLSTSKNIGLISTLHGVDGWWFEKNRLRSIVKTKLDMVLGLMRESQYIAVSEDVKTNACEHLNLKESKVKVIHNGIKVDRFTPKERLRNKAPIIIQVGRIDERKGHLTSLKAMIQILQHIREARLLFVGDGPWRKSIESEIENLRLSKSVQLMGIRDDVPDLLASADIFWMPSESEGLPISCIEAMASGLPIVATNVGGIPEIVVEGETGYLIEKGSHEQLSARTLDLLDNWPLAQEFGQRGRKRVEMHFTIQKTASAYMKAYEDIVEKRW